MNITNYSYINISSTEPLISMANYSNYVTGGLFWYVILIMIFGISYLSSRNNYDDKKALLISIYITSVIGTFLAMAGLVDASLLVFLWFATGLISLLILI